MKYILTLLLYTFCFITSYGQTYLLDFEVLELAYKGEQANLDRTGTIQIKLTPTSDIIKIEELKKTDVGVKLEIVSTSVFPEKMNILAFAIYYREKETDLWLYQSEYQIMLVPIYSLDQRDDIKKQNEENKAIMQKIGKVQLGGMKLTGNSISFGEPNYLTLTYNVDCYEVED